MKKILVLGGTKFIGRNLVSRLQALDEYDITLFNRQQTHADLFPEINKIKGDRETDDINQIVGTHWDYVIDLSCYFPAALSNTLKCLNENTSRYIFISTCSVYDNENNQTILRNEQAEILPCNAQQQMDRTDSSYGNRKAECERILQDAGLEHIILRPALVYGAYDYSDRFYYWLYQVRHNDILLMPDDGERTFSLTYVNDLVDTIIQSLTMTKPNNVYNVITVPRGSIGQVVDCVTHLLDTDPEILNAPAEFLHKNNINQWTDIPLWLDADHFTYNNHKLLEDFEIELTTLKESVKDTIKYFDTRKWLEPKSGMTEKKRQTLINNL